MLNPSRHQVLIVDDDDAVRDSLSLLLKASGFEVSTAADDLEALAVLRNGLPAVLLSDLNMPKMSGVELFSEMRQQFPSVSLVASPRVLLRILSEMLSQSESRIH
jgi:CheY-like chemotaxis protein